MEFFDVAKTISNKQNLASNITMSDCFGLCGIYKRTENLPYLKKILPFIFWIEPQHFYYLMFFLLPYGCGMYKNMGQQKRGVRNPTQRGAHGPAEQDEMAPLSLFQKIQYVLGWSSKELAYNMAVLEVHLPKYKTVWEQELGVDNG
jgi:hypothetical protein